MKKIKSYIDDDGEVRELDEHFFKTATRGFPPILKEEKKLPTPKRGKKISNPKALRKEAGLS